MESTFDDFEQLNLSYEKFPPLPCISKYKIERRLAHYYLLQSTYTFTSTLLEKNILKSTKINLVIYI